MARNRRLILGSPSGVWRLLCYGHRDGEYVNFIWRPITLQVHKTPFGLQPGGDLLQGPYAPSQAWVQRGTTLCVHALSSPPSRSPPRV
jgi:hypothetical protein